MCAIIGVVGLFARCANCATTAAALSVTPSTKWYGDDGTWSAVSIRLGSPQQWLDVLVNTVSSETWVPGAGSCIANDTLCTTNKGSIFTPMKSSTWQEEGFFDLGVDYQLGNTAYAEYGLDNLTFGTTGITIPASIIGAFNGSGSTNTTSYFNGLFGLGITPGNFTNVTPLSAISALVEQMGIIPSHSYGYTAGANYQLKGVLNSLTLGGYDANRLVPHNVSFTLSSSKVPQTFINSITVTSPGTSNATAKTVSLLNTADRVTAIIDSSTPFLWLPATVCNRFASALGLTYNSSLNLYTFDSNASQHDILAASQLSFTFSLSDFASATESVNITLPYAAFDLKLIYPAIPNTNYGEEDSTKYYFPLRQAANEAQYTIGRAFLQEAYLIADYERNTFSVHQAVHVLDSVGNMSLIAITRPSSSTLTGNPDIPTVNTKPDFPKGAIIGIALGALALATLSVALGLLLYRRNHQLPAVSDDKVIDAPPPRPPRRTLIDRIRNRRPPPIHAYEASGCEAYPVEVGADAANALYELDAPLHPAELESESSTTMDGSTEQGSATQDSMNISAYEHARRKMEQAQNARIIQAHAGQNISPVEKTARDISPVAHYRPSDNQSLAPESPAHDSPMVSPMAAEFGSTLGIYSGQPSPVSPGFPAGLVQTPLSPPPTYRRINPDHVVCVGRLPDNVQLPTLVPRIVGPDGRVVHNNHDANIPPEQDIGTHSSLGSQYTIHEAAGELDLYGPGTPPTLSPVHNDSLGSGHGSDVVSPLASTSSGSVAHTFGHYNSHESEAVEMDVLKAEMRAGGSASNLSRRTLGADEIVHVPQPAENRFSWEEERISGHEEEDNSL